ncbi:MAG: efflux RND transporter periplasmic adaptor subunit [Bacteroidetes bacterium]|nr:MAG: efflux RND transporter periplasmic adaptor subunit [Bacteroidota bacterium]
MQSKYLVFVCLFLVFCTRKEIVTFENQSPTVSQDGTAITIPDTVSVKIFSTETVSNRTISADITAPAQVSATVLGNSVILFSNPELTSNYTELLNHRSAISQKEAVVSQKEAVIKQKEAIIKQKQIEIERFEDLATHGAATGKDVTDAKTDKLLAESDKSIAESEKARAEAELIAGKSLIIEHSTKLKLAGFNPETLIDAKAGNAWVIADVSENQIGKVKIETSCSIKFTAYPNEIFVGVVNGIADVMDNESRMTKVRITLENPNNKLRAGMFALLSFGVNEGDFISIDKNSIITVQGKNYVFVKKNAHTFERREIKTSQQIGDRIIVFNGLTNGENVVVSGAMQLKGLSFGY